MLVTQPQLKSEYAVAMAAEAGGTVYVSMKRAEEVYKVVFDELGSIDVSATEELRSTSAT